MRFLIKEYRQISDRIIQSGHAHDDFEFTKKRGWMRLKHQAGGSFSFHRKKNVVLNELGKWEESKTYFFRVESGDIFELDNEKELFEAFGNWLKNLPS